MNDPVNHTDPTGLTFLDFHLTGGSAYSGTIYETPYGTDVFVGSGTRYSGGGGPSVPYREDRPQAQAPSGITAEPFRYTQVMPTVGRPASQRVESLPVSYNDCGGRLCNEQTNPWSGWNIASILPLGWLARATGAARVLPALRQQYVRAVEALALKLPGMRQAGMSSEQIARALHAERRALGEYFKGLTPSDALEKIYQRNLERYGDRLGPSVEWLRDKAGKSWEQIIESATRPGGADLGY